MRIAWFGHVAGKRGNGLISYSRELTSGLRRLGAEVIFFYHGGTERDAQSPNHIRIGALDLFDRAVISSIDAPRIIAETLRERRVDIAHASLSWSLSDFSLPDVCHEQGVPIVGTLHLPYNRHATLMGTMSRTLYRVFATIINKYDRIIIFSEEQRTMLMSMGLPEERIAIIPNGVDTTVFTPGLSTFKEEIGAETVILYLGRVDPEKGVAALCAAFEAIDPPPTVKLVIVGGGADAAGLRERYRWNRRIVFTGVIGDLGKRLNILRGADMFVLPSKMEGLSLSLLEAMACGVATIATDVGSDGEVLRGAGMVIDPESTDAQLRLALETLLQYPDFRRSLAAKARQRVLERYVLADNIRRLMGLYNTVLQRN